MIIAASIEVGTSKLMDASILQDVETSPGRIDIATLLVAALHLAVGCTVLTNAVLVAVARAVASRAGRRAQVRSIGLGSRDDGLGHLVDGLLDGDLLVELLKILLSGLAHEDTLGGLKRNLKGGDSISDLDRSLPGRNAGLVVLSDVHGSHALVTILAGLTVALDVGLDVIKLILEGVAGLGVDLSVVDPEEGVDISDVGTDGIIPVVGKAAGADRSSSGDVHIVRDGDLVEDRTSEAGLNVEDEVLVKLLGGHLVEQVLHLSSIKITTTREADGTLRTVIVKEDKNVILLSRLKSLAAADARHILTSKDLDEVLAVDKTASEILRNSGVHIRASGLVDDLSALGVLRVISNIILHHNNDVLIRNTHLVDNLIGMANISLVTIVIITIGTSSKNNPGVLTKLLLRQV